MFVFTRSILSFDIASAFLTCVTIEFHSFGAAMKNARSP